MNTFPGQPGTRAHIEPSAGRIALSGIGQYWPLAVFWLTAIAAAFVSYDTDAAQSKFWILSAAILLFIAIAALGERYTRLIAVSLAVLGAAIAIGFLLLHDWNTQPADFVAINRIGGWIMAIRPGLPAFELPPNRVGGILAAFLPVVIALAWPRRSAAGIGHPVAGTGDPGAAPPSAMAATNNPVAGTGDPGAAPPSAMAATNNPVAGIGDPALAPPSAMAATRRMAATGIAAIMAFGLIMTSSRAAWFALAAGAGVLLLVRLEARWAAENEWYRRRRNHLHLAGLFALLLLLVLGLLLSEELVSTLDRSLPGQASALSRQRIMLNSFRLAEDFLVTGGGLGAFPGLYSQYMLVVPYYSFGFAHNLYLDAGIEQGLFGVAALAAILILGLEKSLKAAGQSAGPGRSRLAQAVFAGLVVMVVHGFADDAFYGQSGTPLLFVLPALAVHLSRQVEAVSPAQPAPALSRANRNWKWIVRVLELGFLILSFFLFKEGLARTYANLGALQMARVQLADFPAGGWHVPVADSRLAPAEAWLQKALVADRKNRTANQRLGLIALEAGDYETAARYLEAAYAADPRHVGVVKNLGYVYVWLGRFDEALPLLQRIPEARTEMESYTDWWRLHGRRDLSKNAFEMANRLR